MYEGVLADLIDELGRLPGIGPKSAQRIAFHLLQADPDEVRRLAETLLVVKEKVRFCEECGNVSESERCRICRDERRDRTVLCVVEEPCAMRLPPEMPLRLAASIPEAWLTAFQLLHLVLTTLAYT